MPRSARERTLVVLDCRLVFAALAMPVAKVERRFGIVRIDSDGALPGRLCGCRIGGAQNLAEQVQGTNVVRGKRQRGPTARLCVRVVERPLDSRAFAQEISAFGSELQSATHELESGRAAPRAERHLRVAQQRIRRRGFVATGR